MADKGKSGKDLPPSNAPRSSRQGRPRHTQPPMEGNMHQNIHINFNVYFEDPNASEERDTLPPVPQRNRQKIRPVNENRETKRRASPHLKLDRRIRNMDLLPEVASIGPQDPQEEKFKPTKGRRPSPHPIQLRKDHVMQRGDHRGDFGLKEAIVSTGAAGGSLANVDVHPHGEVQQAQEHKDDHEAQRPTIHCENEMIVQEGGGRVVTFIRALGNRFQECVSYMTNRRGSEYEKIPEPRPAQEVSSDSGSHPSLESGPLDLPNVTSYSITDSEESVPVVYPAPVIPHTPSEESMEDVARRAASAPEAMSTSSDSESEDPGRRVKSAAAVLETTRESDHSDSEDDNSDSEDDQRDESFKESHYEQSYEDEHGSSPRRAANLPTEDPVSDIPSTSQENPVQSTEMYPPTQDCGFATSIGFDPTPPSSDDEYDDDSAVSDAGEE